MFEIDFLPVGDGARSGDAIAMRFTRPDTGALAHVIVDGGFQDDGEALVEHVRSYYDTNQIDLVILSHPDADHIGGLGTVIRELQVRALAAHDLSAHGGGDLPAAAAVKELRELAASEGAGLYEPFAGFNAFGGALLIAGPGEDFYEARVVEELAVEKAGTRAAAPAKKGLAAAAERISARVLGAFPVEIPFGDAGGTNPRNNTSTVIDLQFGAQRFVLTGDAGVPAIEAALEYLEGLGRTASNPTLVQVPHHGSRHNASSDCLERLLGAKTSGRRGSALISINKEAAKDPRYPSPRVTNAFGRRGYPCYCIEGNVACLWGDGANRDWNPMTAVPPLDESIDNRP